MHLHPFDFIIPPEKQMPMSKVKEMFLAERSGILNWMIEGLRLYYQEGLKLPTRMIAAREDYRQTSDSVRAFIDELCWSGPAPEAWMGVPKVKGTDLFALYKEYCLENNTETHLTSREFYDKIRSMGFEQKKPGGAVTFYQLAVKSDLGWYRIREQLESIQAAQAEAEAKASESVDPPAAPDVAA